MLPKLLRPKSRGRIHLKSSNPHDHPIIEPNYYTHPDDVESMVEGLKWGLKMARTNSFKDHKIKPVADSFSCGNHEPLSDDYFKCYLSHWSHTVYHPCGTCKMGPKTDAMAVVDSELKVHGFENLRVVDASIMPALVGSNTNAPTVMIGEKDADMIIKSWKPEKIKKTVPEKSEL